MRQLLMICDICAAEYDITFNANKSKFMAFVANSRRSTHHALKDCIFEIGGNRIVNVESFLYLGHIITSKLDDSEDILQKLNRFIGQVNNVLCFKSYCSSIFGSELWFLDVSKIGVLCCVEERFETGYESASCYSLLFIPLSCTLPIYEEICKRSFYRMECLYSDLRLMI